MQQFVLALESFRGDSPSVTETVTWRLHCDRQSSDPYMWRSGPPYEISLMH